MTFCLDTTIIKPENEAKIKDAIILLHGYGGDGKDISILALNWKRHLPNTIFLCPNGHEKCQINPLGYQWFDLTKEDPKYILSEAIKAQNKLNQFINEVKKKFNLSSVNFPDQPGNYRQTLRENDDSLKLLNWTPKGRLEEHINNIKI